jgi:hypothetical protein
MKSSIEIFCPFSLGENIMNESQFLPVMEAGWGSHAIVVVPDKESLVYRVGMSLEEAKEAERKGALKNPILRLKTDDTLFVPEFYMDGDAAGFHGFPHVAIVRQH